MKKVLSTIVLMALMVMVTACREKKESEEAEAAVEQAEQAVNEATDAVEETTDEVVNCLLYTSDAADD